MILKSKKAQEEIVGFALIIIVVAVILLVFLGFSLGKSSQNIQSYEIQSFVQSMIQSTTQCQDNFGYVSVENLIFMCTQGNNCIDGESSCSILNSTLQGMLDQAWPVGSGPIRGYNLNITSNNGNPISMIKGNLTGNSEGTNQNFPNGGNSIEIIFSVYR